MEKHRILIQYFSNVLARNHKEDSNEIYSLFGQEIITLLQQNNFTTPDDIVLSPIIAPRIELGSQYADLEGIFPHGIFIFDTREELVTVKELMSGLEYIDDDNRHVRLFDIDVYLLYQGQEIKVDSRKLYSGRKLPLLDDIIAKVALLSSDMLWKIKRNLLQQTVAEILPTLSSKRYILRHTDWVMLFSIFQQELSTIVEAYEVPSRSNIVRSCIVECNNSRHYVFLKEFLPYPRSNSSIQLPPIPERIKRTVYGNRAIKRVLSRNSPLQVSEILGWSYEFNMIVERDAKIPYVQQELRYSKDNYENLALGLSLLHSTSYGVPPRTKPFNDSNTELMFALNLVQFRINCIRKWGNRVVRSESEPTIEVFQDLLRHSADSLKNNKGALCHGDLAPKNIIQNEYKIFYLTDFEHVCYHDPAFDVGFFAGHLLYYREQQEPHEAIEFCVNFLRKYAFHLHHLGISLYDVEAITKRAYLYAYLACQYRRAETLQSHIKTVNR